MLRHQPLDRVKYACLGVVFIDNRHHELGLVAQDTIDNLVYLAVMLQFSVVTSLNLVLLKMYMQPIGRRAQNLPA